MPYCKTWKIPPANWLFLHPTTGIWRESWGYSSHCPKSCQKQLPKLKTEENLVSYETSLIRWSFWPSVHNRGSCASVPRESSYVWLSFTWDSRQVRFNPLQGFRKSRVWAGDDGHLCGQIQPVLLSHCLPWLALLELSPPLQPKVMDKEGNLFPQAYKHLISFACSLSLPPLSAPLFPD